MLVELDDLLSSFITILILVDHYFIGIYML